jgi:hypothetical protein
MGGEGARGGGRLLTMAEEAEAGDIDLVDARKEPFGGEEAVRRWLGMADRISMVGEFEGVGVVRLLTSSSASPLPSDS